MTPEQQFALADINTSLIVKTTDEVIALHSLLQGELDQRNAIASKEKAITLAKKVENATGKDQNVPKLEKELHQARKLYAVWSSTQPLYYLRKPMQKLESMVSVHKPKPAHTDRPVWEITSELEDGTEQHLGYSYGEPELPAFQPTENK